jgi:hypothetical protein
MRLEKSPAAVLEPTGNTDNLRCDGESLTVSMRDSSQPPIQRVDDCDWYQHVDNRSVAYVRAQKLHAESSR